MSSHSDSHRGQLSAPFLPLTPSAAASASDAGSAGSSLSSSLSFSPPSDSVSVSASALENEALALAEEREFDAQVLQPMLRDKSPAARARRRRMFFRAVLGEFFATIFFFFFVLAASLNFASLDIPAGTALPAGALVTALGATATIYSFSEISGAHFNPAVTFGVWLVGKTSNRKFLFFLLAQFLGINFVMLFLYFAFDSPKGFDSVFDALAIRPVSSNYGRVFFIEFCLTFLLIAVIFLVVLGDIEAEQKHQLSLKGFAAARGLTIYHASAGSKAGMAPLAIGFTLGALTLLGGSVSGGCFNPVRLFSSALWSGVWDGHWAYWLGQLSGAAAAAGLNVLFGKVVTAGGGKQNIEQTFRHEPNFVSAHQQQHTAREMVQTPIGNGGRQGQGQGQRQREHEFI